MYKVLSLIYLSLSLSLVNVNVSASALTLTLDDGVDHFPIRNLGNDVELTCNECKTLFDTIKVFDRTKVGHDIVQDLANNICKRENGFGNCKQFCSDLCHGLISEYAPVIWSLSDLSTNGHFCEFLGFCEYNQTQISFNQLKFTFAEPSNFHIPSIHNLLSNLKARKISEMPYYFLQLTDLHIDTEYHMDTAINCGLPQCCRIEYNKTLDGQPMEMSKKFGSFSCDTPNATWLSMLDEVKNLDYYSKFKFILVTGDLPSHNIWNQSHSKNLDTITKILNDLDNAFPDTPIYYIFGNHDNFPINLCTTNPKVETSYNALDYFKQISTLGWFKWLSDDAKETFLESGQYRTLVNGTDLLLIALNSNLFTSGNLWLASEDQFQIGNVSLFLEESFNKFPTNPVYVINHIPFYSNDFLPNVIDPYNILANQNRVKGIFEGHQHTDNFHLMYDKNGLPSQVAYSPPSLVPGQTNPSFRYYSVDPNSWELLDYYQYRMNLTDSNQAEQVTWYLAYQAKNKFELKDLSASSWFNFVKTLNDQTTFDDYLKNVFHGGLPITENKKEVICSLLTDRVDLTSACMNSNFFQ